VIALLAAVCFISDAKRKFPENKRTHDAPPVLAGKIGSLRRPPVATSQYRHWPALSGAGVASLAVLASPGLVNLIALAWQSRAFNNTHNGSIILSKSAVTGLT
jgi:hypothetical protein